jgi:hypothetical protein
MQVPFEEIYNYISSIAGDDIIIYRWYPHGSKNLLDLGELEFRRRSWTKFMDSQIMIMHDQEPLDFRLYDAECLATELPTWYQRHLVPLAYQAQNSQVLEHVRHLNLASICYGNVTADVNIICHSEQRSSQVALYQNVGLHPVYWWSHAAIARDWYRYAQHDARLAQQPRHYDQDFVCYNRAWGGSREYRLKFADLVLHRALLPAARMGFSPIDNGVHWRDHVYRNDAFKVGHDLEWLPINQAGAGSSASYDRHDYTTCWWDVVLETLFDDDRWHLTEKTLRPIACGKPFLLAATPGSLQYLRTYGFRTFGDIVDESYDQIQDPVQRLEAIVDVMDHIRQLSTAERLRMQRELYDITAHNQRRFFSAEFIHDVWQELRDNLSQARQHTAQQRQGRNWQHLRSMLKSNAEHAVLIGQDNPRRSRRDIAALLRRCRARSGRRAIHDAVPGVG